MKRKVYIVVWTKQSSSFGFVCPIKVYNTWKKILIEVFLCCTEVTSLCEGCVGYYISTRFTFCRPTVYIVHNISKPDNNPHAILYWYSYKRNVKKSLWCRYCCLRGDKPLTVWDRGEETLIPQTVFPTCETSSSPECRAGDQSQVVWRWLWSPHVNMFTHKVTHNTIQKNKQDSRVSSSYP